MMGGTTSNAVSYTGENSTYSLQFQAPQLQCRESKNEMINETLFTGRRWDAAEESTEDSPAWLAFQIPGFESVWNMNGNELTFAKYAIDYIHAAPKPGPQGTRNVTLNIQKLSCHGQSRIFVLKISYLKTGLSMERTLGDMKSLEPMPKQWTRQINGALPKESASFDEGLRSWVQMIAENLPMMNNIALLDAMGSWIEANSTQLCLIPMYTATCSSRAEYPTGSDCPLNCHSKPEGRYIHSVGSSGSFR